MPRLRINGMKLENFKGVRFSEFWFGDTITDIRGANATGKTTIADAFTWVLWNKDSKGNAPGSDNFREKPLDENGNEVHNLETSVTLDCTLDGKPFVMQRIQTEVWTKKRGNMDAVYGGNASRYLLNGVEMKLSELQSKVAEIASKDVLKVLGTLNAFNTLRQDERRKLLLGLVDHDVDAELLSMPEFRPLADQSAEIGVSVDDLKKVLDDRRKKLNAELKMLPVRIDEAKKSCPEVDAQKVRDAEFIIADSMRGIDTVNVLIAEAKAQTGTAGLQDRISALEKEALSIQRAVAFEHSAGRIQLENERDVASRQFVYANGELSSTKSKLEAEKREMEANEAKRQVLRAEWSKVYEEQFVADVETNCPTCGQPLPADKLEEAKSNAKAAFDLKKKTRLDEITTRGKQTAKAVEDSKANIARYEAMIEDFKKDIATAEKNRDEAYAKLNDYPEQPDYSSEPRIERLQDEIKELRVQASASPSEKVHELEARRDELNEIIARNREIIALRDMANTIANRVAELETRQRECGEQAFEAEQTLALIGRFVIARCAKLEDTINAHFPTLRWKLFDTQINGGINETCVAMIECESGLVAYESANTAAQVNADVEIVNVFSEHYDTFIPLFVDNAERVNRLSESNTQVIMLTVSDDECLKIRKE